MLLEFTQKINLDHKMQPNEYAYIIANLKENSTKSLLEP